MANNQNNETANTIGLVMMIGFFMVLGFGIILVVIAAFLTLVALCAQVKPVTIGGETITAKDGRRFIFWGLMGATPCAALLLQLATWMNLRIEDDWMPAVFVLGYSIASLAIAWMVETFWGENKTPVQHSENSQLVSPPPPPADERKTYSFADWDDDDQQGRTK